MRRDGRTSRRLPGYIAVSTGSCDGFIIARPRGGQNIIEFADVIVAVYELLLCGEIVRTLCNRGASRNHLLSERTIPTAIHACVIAAYARHEIRPLRASNQHAASIC